MIQDIAPHHLDIDFSMQRQAESTDYAIIMQDAKVLVDETGCIPTFEALQLSPQQGQYLFHLDTRAFYLVDCVFDQTQCQVLKLHYSAPSAFRTVEPQHLAFADITAVQLANFYHRNRFCSTCAHPLEHHPEERALRCPACGRIVYPRINPAVIVAVVDGDRIVLTKYANRPFRRYALIAGYCEVSEAPEDTVRREVFEETGLRVGRIAYYKSQPWSFSETLLMGFVAQLDGSDEIKIDTRELSVAQWVHRSEIPDDMGEGSLTREMILAFRDGKIG